MKLTLSNNEVNEIVKKTIEQRYKINIGTIETIVSGEHQITIVINTDDIMDTPKELNGSSQERVQTLARVQKSLTPTIPTLAEQPAIEISKPAITLNNPAINLKD